MATRKRKMFGEDKPIQRNKETKNPRTPNRSPGQSNAAKPFPSVREDVGPSVKRDAERIVRGANPNAKTSMGAKSQVDAGKRAVGRMAGRVGYVGAAGELGYAAGTALNEKYKISDAIVDKLPKTKTEKQVNLDYRKDSEMDKFKAGPRMDDDGKRLRDINAHKWKGTM
jgi:hypothetical protein